MVPVDLSDRNERALGAARRLAHARGGRVTLFHVIQRISGIAPGEFNAFYRRRTFSVFAEHAAGDAPRHDGRYTVALARASRYPSAEAVSSCAYPLAHLEVRRVRPGRTERCPLDGGERRPRRRPSGAARLDGAAPHGRRARHPRPSRCLVLVCGR